MKAIRLAEQKNIAFSGKGLVAKPANPRSVIINKNSSKAFVLDDNSRSLNIGDFTMSDVSVLEKRIAELKTALASTEQENKEIKAKIEEAKDKEFASQVEAFEASIEEKQGTIAELEESVKSTQARVAELEDALKASKTEIAAAMKNMDEMKKKEKMEKRKAALTEAGLDEEETEATLASLEALEDDAFDSVVAVMKKKAVMKDEKKEDEGAMKPKAEQTEAEVEEVEATAEVFEQVETSEATLVEPATDEADELESTRASLSNWISENILSK